MTKKPTYPPLALLQSINNEVPRAWELMKILHESNGEDYKMELLGHIDIIKSMQIAALAPWRRSKDVFVVDPDMRQLLIEQRVVSRNTMK